MSEEPNQPNLCNKDSVQVNLSTNLEKNNSNFGLLILINGTTWPLWSLSLLRAR